MTTGRINQVNGGTKGVWNQPFLCGHAPPIDPPSTEANGEPNRWCLCESVASLFPPWSEGQCLAPSTDGRGPSRAHKRSTPKETRRFYPARSNEEQGTVREGSPGQMGSRTHHRHSVARTRPRDRGSHRSKGYRSRRAHRQSRVARSISSAKTSDRAETLTWPSPARASVRGGPRVETARVAPYASHLSRATKY